MPGQRLARFLDTNARAIDQVKGGALTQQVVQVQVFLPDAFGVHLAHGGQGIAKHRLLLVGQRREIFHRFPNIPQALRLLQKLEQQPAALAFLQPVGQQQRRGQALFCQRLYAVALTLEMPRGFGADQQFRQHRAPAPDARADVALTGQDAQQAEQLQLGRTGRILQRDVHRQRRGATGVFQFRQTHRRPL